MDMILQARLLNAAYCERHGIAVSHPFTAADLAPAHEQLAEAERDVALLTYPDRTDDEKREDLESRSAVWHRSAE